MLSDVNKDNFDCVHEEVNSHNTMKYDVETFKAQETNNKQCVYLILK